MADVVTIARCPEHGLHGERDACFVCGGPVEQVPMVPVTAREWVMLVCPECGATVSADELGDELWCNGRMAIPEGAGFERHRMEKMEPVRVREVAGA